MKLEQFLNAAVIEGQHQLKQEFTTATPFRHVIIDNFLQADLCQGLLDQFPSFNKKQAVNEDGVVGGKAVNEHVVNLPSPYPNLDKLVQTSEFRQLISNITAVPRLQHDPYYYGGGTHENLHGQALDAHIDFNYHPITGQHRRLNLIIYLNQEWKQEWGGALNLHRDPYLPPAQDDICTVLPLFNRCVIFETTEYSWHGFEEICLPDGKRQLSRKSFALYYYTDERPPEEIGPRHSTVYVNRHLPDQIRPGSTLSEKDHQTIHSLLDTRDQHLKRLYRNIAELSEHLNGPNLTSRRGGAIFSGYSAEGRGLLSNISYLENELSEIYRSTSWRITKPLRWVGRGLKQMLKVNTYQSNLPRACPVSGAEGDKLTTLGRVPTTNAGQVSRKHYDLIYSSVADIVYLDPAPGKPDLDVLYTDSSQFSSAEYIDEHKITAMMDYYSGCVRRHFKLDQTEGFRLLEVGAGMAWVSKAVKGIRPDAHTQAQDISEECGEHCDWVDEYYVGSVASFAAKAAGKYHAISLTHVIEHIPDPVAMVRRLRKLLLPGGVLFITAPFRPPGWTLDAGLEPWLQYPYLHVPAHITYFSRTGLKLLAAVAGMKLSYWDSTADNRQAFEALLKAV